MDVQQKLVEAQLFWHKNEKVWEIHIELHM